MLLWRCVIKKGAAGAMLLGVSVECFGEWWTGCSTGGGGEGRPRGFKRGVHRREGIQVLPRNVW